QFFAGLDLDLKGTDFGGLGIAPRLAGADVEFPAVPRAAHELTLALDAVLAGTIGQHDAGDHPGAQRPSLMRTAVGDGKILAVDIEDADLAALHFHDLVLAGLQLPGIRDDMTTHL